MIHPDTQLQIVADEIGYGVVATRPIPRGTAVWVKDDLDIELPPDHPLLRDPRYAELINKYSFVEGTGMRIICWDIGKYVNHCCHPSTLSTGYGFEIALKGLQPGDEITDDYGIFNPDFRMSLICNKPACRSMLLPSDFEDHYPEWDRQIKAALVQFFDVPQPLLELIDPKLRDDLRRYLETGRNYRSVYACRYIPLPRAVARR